MFGRLRRNKNTEIVLKCENPNSALLNWFALIVSVVSLSIAASSFLLYWTAYQAEHIEYTYEMDNGKIIVKPAARGLFDQFLPPVGIRVDHSTLMVEVCTASYPSSLSDQIRVIPVDEEVSLSVYFFQQRGWELSTISLFDTCSFTSGQDTPVNVVFIHNGRWRTLNWK